MPPGLIAFTRTAVWICDHHSNEPSPITFPSRSLIIFVFSPIRSAVIFLALVFFPQTIRFFWSRWLRPCPLVSLQRPRRSVRVEIFSLDFLCPKPLRMNRRALCTIRVGCCMPPPASTVACDDRLYDHAMFVKILFVLRATWRIRYGIAALLGKALLIFAALLDRGKNLTV